MANFRILRGKEKNLPQELKDGYAYFCTDTSAFYVDCLNEEGIVVRIKASNIGQKTEEGGFSSGLDTGTYSGGAIGKWATSYDGGAVGDTAETSSGFAGGANAYSIRGGAVGSGAVAENGFSGGAGAQVDLDENEELIDAIQLGTGTNSNPKTLQIYEHTLMNADGTIPEERLSKAKDYIDSIKYYDDPNVVPTDASYFEYTDNEDGTCVLTKLTDTTLTDVVVPYEINGLKVTSIGGGAFRDSSIISVILPNTITSIGNSAFRESTLASINIPNSVITIGTYVFYKCTSLTSIVLPNTITSIGQYAFSYSHITSIVLPDNITTIAQSTFFECNKLVSVFIPNSVTTIEKNAFHGCYWLSGINIPNSVTSLGEQVFEDCNHLTSIIIPNSVTNIGAYAFTLTELKNISIPDTITSINKYTFTNCQSLKHVTIPNSITSIREAAFAGCTLLKSITIPSSVTSIEKYAFGFSSINLTKIYCDKNSFAETYAIENNIPYEYIEAKDYIGNTSELNTENKETVVGAINELAEKLISETDVDSKIAAMVDSAPETLDTLNELATALGDDPNFASTVATEIGKKADAKTEKGGFQGGDGANTTSGGAIGSSAQAGFGGAVGRNTYTDVGGAIGLNAKAGAGGAIGWNAKAGIGFSGGSNAIAGKDSEGNYIDAIQLGLGANNKPKTLQVYDYTMMNADGTIPEERLTKAKDYTNNKIAEFVNSAPEALNTLNELAAALGEDTNFATTVVTEIGKKADVKTEKGGFQGGDGANATFGGAVGYYTQTENGGAVGGYAKSSFGGAVGYYTQTLDGGSIGWNAKSGNGFSGGYCAKASTASNGRYIDAIQLGQGTNSNPKSLQVYDYTMMNADGTIPEERLPILANLATIEYVNSKIGSTNGEGVSTLGFDYYYETDNIDIDDPNYQRIGIHKIKKTGTFEQPTIIMTQEYAGGLQQLLIRCSFIRMRQIKPDGTLMEWNDYVLNSKLEEKVAESKAYTDEKIGNIDTLLDSVLAIEQELIGETLVDTSIAVCDSYINGGVTE